jgi:hypothetical protein
MRFTIIGLGFLFFFALCSCEPEETSDGFLDLEEPVVDVPKTPVDSTVTETTTKLAQRTIDVAPTTGSKTKKIKNRK